MLKSLRNASVSGKTVFVRCDCDVSLNGLSIEDDTRLRANLQTIEYLLGHGARVIIGGHLGRPERFEKSLSMEPVAIWFVQRLKIKDLRIKNEKIGEFEGWGLGENLFVLENLRFYKGEEENDAQFARSLASFADLYVNDAFAVSHRSHASIAGVPKLLPHFAGFHLEKEIEVLTSVLEHPKRPLVVIIGGAKLETKLPMVSKMHKIADYVLVGGKIAQGTKELLKVQHEKVTGRKSVLLVGDLNSEGTDITDKTTQNFLQIIQLAKTVVWNGPVGKVESRSKNLASRRRRRSGQEVREDTERGSRKLAEGIVQSGAYTIVGGGDTLGFLKKIHLLDKFDFASTGGGAMLALLSGDKLPGLEALIL